MKNINQWQTTSETTKAAMALADLIGEEMVGRLELMALTPKNILLVGYAAGNVAALLQKRFPDASVVIAHEKPQAQTFDLVIAHWILPFIDLNEALHEWRRVLSPQGLLLFNSLGPDTLKNLPEKEIYLLAHLTDMHLIGDALVQQRFTDPVMDVDYYTLNYQDSNAMVQELKACGLLHASCDLSQSAIHDAPFEIIYGQAWRPSVESDQSIDAAGHVSIPLSQLRGRTK